jgi:hypothetical protein
MLRHLTAILELIQQEHKNAGDCIETKEKEKEGHTKLKYICRVRLHLVHQQLILDGRFPNWNFPFESFPPPVGDLQVLHFGGR